jgi:hypothetical protein
MLFLLLGGAPRIGALASQHTSRTYRASVGEGFFTAGVKFCFDCTIDPWDGRLIGMRLNR